MEGLAFFAKDSQVVRELTPHYLEIQIRAEEEEADALLARLRTLSSDSLPRDRDLVSADRELNAVWKAILSRKELFEGDGARADRSALVDAQKAWIRYRDAWAEFGIRRFPASSAAVWKTMATKERVRQLRAYLDR